MFVYKLKIVMGLPRGHCTFLLFPSALTSLCTPGVAQAWSHSWTYLLNKETEWNRTIDTCGGSNGTR